MTGDQFWGCSVRRERKREEHILGGGGGAVLACHQAHEPPRGYHIASAPFLAAQSCPGLPLGTVTAGLEVGLQASLKAPPYSFDQGSLLPSPQSLFQGL